ncbi:hypothetical protein AAF712_005402 [Marasmius tenuissimus]|uniref:Uncharacterized protein n=1 Tax=Marasmius tenuissimus TaxID=585030 RepID=A0ABR3A2W0_9AGAR
MFTVVHYSGPDAQKAFERDFQMLRWISNATQAWMSQASSVFHARGTSLEEDLSVYRLGYQWAWLLGFLSEPKALREQSRQPIYLYVRPPPLDLPDGYTSVVHSWSLDEDGQFPLPHNVCNNLGLPFQVELIIHYYLYSWSNHHYALIHQYQILRGFDPSTLDFAQHLGFESIYQPVNDSGRFERLRQDSPLEGPSSTPTPDSLVTPTRPLGSAIPLRARQSTSSGSRIPVPVGGFKHFGRRRRDS